MKPCSSDPARIWWCPTGPLVFLPIHAAGIYNEGSQSSGSCVSDFVVSSYAPTVGTLLEKVKASGVGEPSTSKVLLVSQKHTQGLPPTPGAIREMDSVKKILGADNCIHLDGATATVSQVKQEMNTCSWVHFACIAAQNIEDPLKSRMYLHDGPLELLEITRLRIPQCKFAFLSVCQSAMGDKKLPDEVVHLAAGMLAAGCHGVVGTMWSIKDNSGAMVAEPFYEYLAAQRDNNESDGGSLGNRELDSSRAAYALHHAVQQFRKRTGDTERGLLEWVPYVHFGL